MLIARKVFLVIALIFSILFLLHSAQDNNEKSIFQNSIPQKRVLGAVSIGIPARLIIPAINVDANIQYVGVTPKGAMEVPNNTSDVGWFKLGSRPGKKGSAVISGHFDGKNGEPAVFTNLNKLKKGDKLYIKDDKGISIAFVVRESRIYNPGYADEVFSLNDGTHLNLVTCDGVWDGTKKSFTKRLVVFADIMH